MTEITREEVVRRRNRLFERFGEVPVETRRKRPERETFDAWREASLAGYVGSAYALVRRSPERLPPLTESAGVDGPERERVLLLLGRGRTRWGVPGGGQEADERYTETVHREVREETGVDAEPTGLAWLRHEISTHEGSDDRLHVLRAFFHAAYTGGSIDTQPGEANGAAWFAEPPVADRLLPETERLLDGWNGKTSATD